MDEKTFKRLLKDELRPLKDLIELTKKKVDSQDIHIVTTTQTVRIVKDQQSIMNEKLDSHSGSLVSIESKLDSYADSYKENQRSIVRLDTRLTTVEDELTINVPEDLKVPHFSPD